MKLYSLKFTCLTNLFSEYKKEYSSEYVLFRVDASVGGHANLLPFFGGKDPFKRVDAGLRLVKVLLKSRNGLGYLLVIQDVSISEIAGGQQYPRHFSASRDEIAYIYIFPITNICLYIILTDNIFLLINVDKQTDLSFRTHATTDMPCQRITP